MQVVPWWLGQGADVCRGPGGHKQGLAALIRKMPCPPCLGWIDIIFLSYCGYRMNACVSSKFIR